MIRVGVYSITGCAGCMLSIIFNEKEILALNDMVHIAAFPFIKEGEEQNFDILFVEGVVVHKDDLETLRSLRERTKYMIALGACACTGGVPSYRNFVPYSNYKHLVHKKEPALADLEPRPIDDYVNVDYYMPGCPPDKAEILSFFKDAALGKKPKPYTEPVCVECRLNGNFCLLDRDRLCLGPVTRGGCNSICINGGLECWGCRGHTDDANFDTMEALLRTKGFTQAFIRERARTFVGMKLPNPWRKK
jgi:coenzyme F420-reducing hydrogenase gamma subunit